MCSLLEFCEINRHCCVKQTVRAVEGTVTGLVLVTFNGWGESGHLQLLV